MVEWQTKNAQVAETRHTVQKRCGSSPNNYKSGSWRPNKSKFQSIVKSLRLDRSRAIKERDGGVRFCISRHCGGTPGCTVSNTDAGCSVFYLLFSRSIFSASKSSKDSIHFLDESVIYIFRFFPVFYFLLKKSSNEKSLPKKSPQVEKNTGWMLFRCNTSFWAH